MIIDGLSWHQFSNLPHIASLPLNRQLIEYEIYNQNLIHEVMMIQQQQQLLYPNVPSAAGSATLVSEVVEEIPAGCIQFVVNTTEGTYFEFSVRSNTNEFTYTVNWGDDVIEEGASGEGYAGLNHTYPDGVADYTVRICFSDPSIIHNIDFPGFD